MDHAVRLLNLHFFSHLHAILADTNLYTLERKKRLYKNAIKQLQLTTPALSSLLASLSFRIVQHSIQSDVQRSELE